MDTEYIYFSRSKIIFFYFAQLAYSIVKFVTNEFEHGAIYDPLVRVCEVLLNTLEGLRGDLMCPGMISYYGVSVRVHSLGFLIVFMSKIYQRKAAIPISNW